MRLSRHLEAQGEMLFRHRSRLPLILVPCAIVATTQSGYFNALCGDNLEEIWMVFCALVSGLGILIRWLTVGHVSPGTSGRITRNLRAGVLNTSGMYSVVRNPLYLGNYLIILGIALATRTWWFPVLSTMAFALFYERVILAEERFLSGHFGEDYLRWAGRTPAFFPALSLWRGPERRFSLRMALRREYGTMFGTLAALTAIELGDDLLGEGMSLQDWIREDYVWWLVLCAGSVSFVIIKLVRKHTKWLRVELVEQGAAGGRNQGAG